MDYTFSQKRAIDSIDKSLVVTASAGSGKTRILVGRYENLVRHAIMPAQILTFTFTIKAASEIKGRLVESGVLTMMDELTAPIGTLHSFIVNLLKRYGHKVGLMDKLDILDSAASAVLKNDYVKSWILKNLGQKNAALEQAVAEWGFKYVFSLFSELSDDAHLHLYRWTHDETGLIEAIKTCQAEYQKEKLRFGKLDFHDLEQLTLELLEQNQDILTELQNQYRHIMVDEFQDINPIQGKLVKLLYKPGINTLFIVGDPKQSIYRFRAADVSVFFEMSDHILANGGESIKLVESFRMTHPIADCVNKLFSGLMKIPYDPLVPQRIDEPGFVKFIIAPTSGEKIDAIRKAQAHYIAQILSQFKDNPEELKKSALLFRSKTFFSVYTEAFKRFGIPYRVSKTSSLLQEQIVLDLIAFLNYFAGASDLLTLARILRSPLLGFSEPFIHHFCSSKLGDFLNGYVVDLFALQTDSSRWQIFLNLLHHWHQLRQQLAPKQFFLTLLADLHFFEEQNHELPGFITSPYNESSSRYAVEQFLGMLDEEIPLGADAYQFLQRRFNNLLSLEADIDCLEQSGNQQGVLLMSVHAAKGLEFDRVFLPDVHAPDKAKTGPFLMDSQEGLFAKREDPEQLKGLKKHFLEKEPYRRIKEKEHAEILEEHKRLLYVAMTRAKNELYLFIKTPRNTNKDEAKNWNSWIYTHLGKECLSGDELNRDPVRSTSFINLASKIENKLITTTAKTLDHFDTPLKINETFSNKKPVYSVSELEAYHHCGKLYELKYIKCLGALNEKKTTFFQGKSNIISPNQWGTLVHEIFQYLDFSTLNNLPTVIDQALINQGLVDSGNTINEACTQLVKKITEEPSINGLLLENNFETEQEFILNQPDFMIRGTMDRLIYLNNTIHILDYKTDFFKSETALQHKMDLYFFQLGVYALAVSKMSGIKNITTSLIFTHGPKLITKEWSLEELENINITLTKLHHALSDASSFDLAKNLSLCPSCPYYALNYCGVVS